MSLGEIKKLREKENKTKQNKKRVSRSDSCFMRCKLENEDGPLEQELVYRFIYESTNARTTSIIGARHIGHFPLLHCSS